jgi:hypothetical protein
MFDEPDHDLFKIALSLEPGRSATFLCEGCDIRGVHKDEEGHIYLVRDVEGEMEFERVEVETLIQ